MNDDFKFRLNFSIDLKRNLMHQLVLETSWIDRSKTPISALLTDNPGRQLANRTRGELWI
jgi:hypothetical protein